MMETKSQQEDQEMLDKQQDFNVQDQQLFADPQSCQSLQFQFQLIKKDRNEHIQKITNLRTQNQQNILKGLNLFSKEYENLSDAKYIQKHPNDLFAKQKINLQNQDTYINNFQLISQDEKIQQINQDNNDQILSFVRLPEQTNLSELFHSSQNQNLKNNSTLHDNDNKTQNIQQLINMKTMQKQILDEKIKNLMEQGQMIENCLFNDQKLFKETSKGNQKLNKIPLQIETQFEDKAQKQYNDRYGGIIKKINQVEKKQQQQIQKLNVHKLTRSTRNQKSAIKGNQTMTPKSQRSVNLDEFKAIKPIKEFSLFSSKKQKTENFFIFEEQNLQNNDKQCMLVPNQNTSLYVQSNEDEPNQMNQSTSIVSKNYQILNIKKIEILKQIQSLDNEILKLENQFEKDEQHSTPKLQNFSEDVQKQKILKKNSLQNTKNDLKQKPKLQKLNQIQDISYSQVLQINKQNQRKVQNQMTQSALHQRSSALVIKQNQEVLYQFQTIYPSYSKQRKSQITAQQKEIKFTKMPIANILNKNIDVPKKKILKTTQSNQIQQYDKTTKMNIQKQNYDNKYLNKMDLVDVLQNLTDVLKKDQKKKLEQKINIYLDKRNVQIQNIDNTYTNMRGPHLSSKESSQINNQKNFDFFPKENRSTLLKKNLENLDKFNQINDKTKKFSQDFQY